MWEAPAVYDGEDVTMPRCDRATNMARPSVSIPDELLEEFDDQIDDMRRSGELDLDTSRSEVVQELIRQWLEGKSNSISTDSKATATAD